MPSEPDKPPRIAAVTVKPVPSKPVKKPAKAKKSK
jgi:hypothetical protein